MRPLRVAHLISGDLWAGAEAATFELLAALAARDDVALRVVLLNEGVLAARLREAGVATHVVPESRLGLAALGRTLRPILADADLVHAHRAKEDWLAHRSGRPWIATRHGRPEPFTGLRGLRAAAVQQLDLRTLRRGARRVIAVSEEVATWLRRRLPADRVAVVPNGLRDPWTREPPPPWRGRARRAGVLARLVPVKAVDLALDVVARVPDLVLEVVGDGPEAAALRRRAAVLGLTNRVEFTGFLSDPKARVAQWKVLLVTSLHEGHPMSVLEAMAAATPVAAVPLPGVMDTLGAGGRIARSRAACDVAAALEELLEERTGERASQAAREAFLERFTVARTAAATAALYRAAMRAGPAKGGTEGGSVRTGGEETCFRKTDRAGGPARRPAWSASGSRRC